MSTPYVRRPVLEGNTEIPVQVQPYLQGTVRKTSTGVVAGFSALVATASADLVVESEAMGGGPTTVTFAAGHSDLLSDIIDTLNAALAGTATASERDGCLRLQTVGVGETVLGVKSFIRVHPATNDYDADGVANDTANLFGFACYPDPAATVTAGDFESSATRPIEQGNFPGTRFVARGEDRTAAAFNRALAQLALNADITRTSAVREAYYPVSVTIDASTTNWDVASGRLRFDGSGRVTQIKLADLDAVDARWSGRLYVGNLSRSSTLREISKYWGITDSSGKELLVYDDANNEIRTLRVGAVTRGESGFGRPDFADENSAPSIVFPDTADVGLDGANVLGVVRLKQPTTAITGIKGKTNIVCSSLSTPGAVPTAPTAGVGFLTHGISRGDFAVVSDATVTSPFCHNGVYYVEDVVSEQELILRPLFDTDVESLNPDESGSFGSVTIYTSGEWSSDVWITLDPPLPRFPEDSQLVLTFGMERETLNQREDVGAEATDTSSVQRTPSDPQLTGFQSEQFWQRQSLGGAYAGMSQDRTADAGSIIKARTRSVTVVAPNKAAPSAGTYVRGAFSGTLIGDGILVAESAAVPPHPDTFTLADVGRVVKLTGGALLALEPFLITEFIDGAHVRLAPLGASPGAELPAYGVVDYEVYDDVVDYPNPLLTLIAPDQDRAGNDLSDVGVLYLREQNDTGTPPTMPTRQHGRSLLHLERVSVGYISPGSATSIRTVVITGTTATTVTVGASVESFQNIFAVEGGDTRPVEAPYNGGSVFRIMNGPNAGFYLIQKTTSTNELTLRTLDGDSVLLDTTVATVQIGAFYNAHVSVGHKLAGTSYGDVAYRTAKLRVFFDSLEQGEEAGAGLSIDWRGQGAGITAQLNDADFVAYDSEAGAVGYLLDANIYAPAHGINLTVTGAASGDAQRRSARGANLKATGHQISASPSSWGALVGSEDLSSWAVHAHQDGSDPVLVVTKGVDVGADFAHPTDAAIQVRLAPATDAADRLYRAVGSALDSTGSVYVRHPQTGSPAGAIYSETGISAFQFLSSFVPPYLDNERAGLYAFDSAVAGTELGSADQAYPVSTADTAPTADLLAPDYVAFPFHHLGVVRVVGDSSLTDFLSPYGLGAERHVGKVVEVTGSSSHDGEYTVLALKVDAATDTSLFAVVKYSATASWTGTDSGTIKIYGRRWNLGYLNIADYALIGTWDSTASRTDLPALTSADLLINERQTTWIEDTQFPELGLQSYVPWASSVEGVSLGFAGDLTSPAMAHVYVSAIAYSAAAGWSGGSAGPLYSHGWSHDTKEPRSPFPNKAVFSGGEFNTGDTSLSSGSLNSLAADDYTAEFVTGPGTVSWSSAWGGSLYVDFAGSTATVRLWQRGRTYVLSAHLAVKVQLRIAGTGLSNEAVTTALRTASGTVVAAHTFTTTLSGVPRDLTTTLLVDNLYKGARDALGNSLLSEALHLTVDLSTEGGGSVFLLEMRTEQETRPVVVSGPQVVAGAQLAHSYRFTDPVRGFQTVGPADARLFGGTDYAKNESWPTYDNGSNGWVSSFVTGTQELRGTPGLVRMSSELEMYHWYAALDAAALAPTNTWLTNLQTAVHSGVAWWPTEMANVDTAITTAIATAAPPDARARALDDVMDAIDILYRAMGSTSAEIMGGSWLDTLYLSADEEIRLSSITSLKTAIDAALADTVEGGDYGLVSQNRPSRNWVRPWVEYNRLFTQGVHSATVTLYNGAFDPLWYAYQADKIHNNYGESNEDLQVSAFVLPGTTGFLLPLSPPHGSALTSLSVNLSFRAANSALWGVYFGMPDDLAQMGQAGATDKSYTDVANENLWNDKQGVIVELWRHNSVDFGEEEDQFASWTDHTPEFGFGECIFRQNVDLSAETIPGATDNTVANAWEQVTSADTVVNRDVYVGKELFVRRTWNLVEYFGSTDSRSRVDGRQYSYMLVVRFYGGMRATNAGVHLPYVRGDATSRTGAAEAKWEFPQVISRLKDDGSFTAGTLAEGRLYGHFDTGYDTEYSLDMNKPWGSGSFPPQVKFRGARLGWTTDRAGDGGW